MNEQAVFEAALEIENVAKREAFIEKACAGNAELRERVESLLKSHASAGSFLEVPVVQPLKADPNRPVDRTSDFTANTGTVELSEKEEDLAAVLELLQPSSKPGSLGVLGHYEVLQLLGQGGFGIVFKAFDEKLHRLVAIKVMNPQMAATSPPRKRFLREARAAAAVKHENIVQVHSVEEQPLPYLVMEYVEGPTLAQKLDGSGPLETTEVLHVARQIASGLAAAHEKGRIHRDIKPGNILVELGAVQKIKITDFGLARAVDDASLTRTGMIAGTPMYMAPEQALGQTLDHRADLFSLGSVMYQMACGRPPFRASTTIAVLRRVADDTPRPLQEILSEIPDWLVAIVNKLHAKNPEDRFQSAKEVADLLGRCQTELQLNGNVTEVEGIDKPANPKVEAAPAEKAAPSDGPILFFFKSVIAGASLMAMFLMAWSLYTALTSSTEKTWLTATQKPSQAQTHVAQEPDRALAEWVISLGGTVQIDNQANEIVLLNDLPKKAFYVSGINLDASPWITDSDTALFAKAKRLRRLYLANTRLTDDFAAPLAKCENLEELFVHGTQVSRKTFAVCKNLKKLRTFFASGSVDAAVSQLQDCSELDYLSLSISDLSDDGLAHLRNLKNLKTLEVKITPITDAGLENLKELRNLHFLDLKETAVTQAGVNRLREQLPTCKIEWNGGVIEPTVSPDRRAAEYVLSIGGTVRIRENGSRASGGERYGKAVDELPREPFELTSVNLFGNLKVSDAGLANFQNCRNLVGLNLHASAPVSDEALANFKDCQNLLNLQLSRRGDSSGISDAGLLHFQNCKKLEILGLNGTLVTDAGLAPLKDLTSVTHLELQRTKVTDGGLAYFRNCKNLTSLLLDQTMVSDVGMAHFKDHKNITQLSLTHTSVTDTGLAHFRNCKSLALLYLDNTQVSDAGLAHFKDCKDLTHLYLDSTQVSDAGLSNFKNCRNLQQLNLGGSNGTRVSDVGFAYFKDCTQLTSVTLSSSNVSDAALAHFRACKGLTSLKLLDTKTSDAGLEHLTHCPKLIYLEIPKTKVTEDGVKKLAAALPNCKIAWDGGIIEPQSPVVAARPAVSTLLEKGFRVELGNRSTGEVRELTNALEMNAAERLALHSPEKSDQNPYADPVVLDALRAMPSTFTGSLIHISYPLTGDQLRALVEIPVIRSVGTLYLQDSGLKDADFGHLAPLSELTGLYIDGNPALSDAGLKSLGAIPKLVDLQSGPCKITGAGLAALRDKPFAVLSFQNVVGLDDGAVDHLTAMPTLKYIYLKGTKISGDGVKKLSAALPKCKIEWDGGVIEPKLPSEAAKSLIGGLLKAGVTVEVVNAGNRYLQLASVDELIAGDRIGILRISETAAADPESLALLGRLPEELWRKDVDFRAIVFSGPIPADRLQEILALPAIHSVAGLTFMTGDSPLPDTAFTDLIRFKELAHLFLPPNSVSDEAFKTMIAAMPKLSVLGLSGTKITDAGLANLRGRPIRKLELQSCPQIDDAAADHLAAIPTLEYLLLNGTNITDAALSKFTTLSKLTTLNVDGTKVTADGVKKLATALPRCKVVWDGGIIEPNLIEAAKPIIAGLLKSGIGIDFIDASQTRRWKPASIEELAAGDQVETLRIDGAAVADPPTLDLLKRFPAEVWRKEVAYRVIYLTGPFSPERLQEILAIPALQSVGALFLNCGAAPLPESTFADLIRFTELHDLGITGPSVSDKVLKDAIAAMPRLKAILLNGTKVTLSGLVILRERPFVKLEFQSCPQIDDTAADNFAAIPTLELLSLNGTSITDTGIAKLTPLKKLKALNVFGTKVTEEGAKKLAAALPQCHITWNGGVIEPSAK